jgi:ribosomal-protein-alanine N-acetyltransferase
MDTSAPPAAAGMVVAETPRLRLRRMTAGDARFIVELLNDPDWIRFIGDRKVRSEEDARRYLEAGPLKIYEAHGFGLWIVERREDALPIGMCGLVKRPELADVDLGFAFLPRYRGQGYALEAARESLRLARDTYRIDRIVAITDPANGPSSVLLDRLGFALERRYEVRPGDEVLLFAARLGPQ